MKRGQHECLKTTAQGGSRIMLTGEIGLKNRVDGRKKNQRAGFLFVHFDGIRHVFFFVIFRTYQKKVVFILGYPHVQSQNLQ